jgi:hypothetical protein
MEFVLKYTKEDFEGIRASGLWEIESIKQSIACTERFIETLERSIINDRERAEYCTNFELKSIYEELRIKNYPENLRIIEGQREIIRGAKERINRIENNIKGCNVILEEYQFPIDIEFNIRAEGYYKRIVT